MARQCPKPKRKRDATWFRDKVCLVEAQGSGKVLNLEELEFLADPGVAEAKEVLIANLSSYGSDVLSEYLLETQNAAVQDTNSSTQQDAMILSVFKHLSNQVTNCNKINKDNLIANESLSAELERYKEQVKLLEERQNVDLNFGKRFVPQQELSDEQAFRLQTSHPNTDQSASSPVKIEAPRELTKVSMVNTSLKKLKYHLGQFDNVVKKRITPDALTEGEWGFEHTKAIFLKEIIPFVKTLKDIFNVFDKDLLNELSFKQKTQKIKKLKSNIKRLNKTSTTNNVKKDINEIETINIELEHRVTKLIAENEHLKQAYKQLYDSIKPSHVRAKEHADSLVNQLNQNSVEITDLNAQLQEKVFVITSLKNDLRKFKGKDIVNNVAQVSNDTTIAPGMYKLDQVTLDPKDKNNMETHIYYLKHIMEQAAILKEIFE
ncbi:hypothetical protein Tco_1265457 [Tanacetum coccineum]